MDERTAAFLEHEARALLTRLARIKPFALHEIMVPAANVSPAAQRAIDGYLVEGRIELRNLLDRYIAWLRGPQARRAAPADAQRRFTLLRLRFNKVLTHFDLFADVLTQRSEYDTGVWLAGLDAVAADALALPGYYAAPPVVCYLDRGVGAAIRRARTRLPGGGENPVAVIRVPRERMVSAGIASSLVHEVGHQAAALLGLVDSLRAALRSEWRRHGSGDASPWRYWERCISEIAADFWSVARVGIAASAGLVGVLSLPRAFVFRVNLDDPHPFPWIRVKLSCAMGEALYPHPQWSRLARLWESFYPRDDLDAKQRAVLEMLEASMGDFVRLLLAHRPGALQGRSLGEAMQARSRAPAQLLAQFKRWKLARAEMYQAAPALAFAVVGQARAMGEITPEAESRLIAKLLTYWALRATSGAAARDAIAPDVRPATPAPALTVH